MSINWRDKTLGGTILIVAGLVGAALAVVADALPSRFPAGSTPPQLLLAAFGLIVIFGVAIIIALAVKFGLGLSRTTIVTVFTFNVAIVIVKFVLSPLGLYASNASAPFNAQAFLVGINNNMEGFVVAAVGSFLAYLVALTIIYRIVTRDMRTSSSPHKGRYRMVVL
ncbi:MAG TPA: hypothetical protein VMS08_02460, partial [Candidatus Saccharimonadia bacterium]|nr:hypothetical protein [Candidatus Saccharimonadia bacterium]